jgi:hypothetical protein
MKIVLLEERAGREAVVYESDRAFIQSLLGQFFLVRSTTFFIPSPITYFSSFIYLYFLSFPVFSYVTHFNSSYASFISVIIHLRTVLDIVTVCYWVTRDTSHGAYLSPNHSHRVLLSSFQGEGIIFFWNVSTDLPNCLASHPTSLLSWSVA